MVETSYETGFKILAKSLELRRISFYRHNNTIKVSNTVKGILGTALTV